MDIHFTSFIGLAPGAESESKFIGQIEQLNVRQKALHRSALIYGKVDYVHEWSRERLLRTQFYKDNRELLDQPRGCGYWAWKPYVILQTLAQTKPNDYVVYCDVGKPCEGADIDHGNIIHTPLQPLIDWAERHDGMLPGVYLNHHGEAKKWIKRDCFQIMGCDEEPFHQMPTIQAGYTVWKNTPTAIAFLEEWQRANCDPRLITDQNNTLGLENYDGFIRHCHDQATLTLLCEKHGVTAFGDRKKQFWGFRNINYIALEAAYRNAENAGELCLAKINAQPMIVPHYLVRWIELLTLYRQKDSLNVVVTGSLSENQKHAWGRYLPNANFTWLSTDDILSVNETLSVNDSDGFDLIIALPLSQKNEFNNDLLATLYQALRVDGVIVLGALPKPMSELEKTGRFISSKGLFTNANEFSAWQTFKHSPKIPNSRNPIFLAGRNSHHSGTIEGVMLMVKPTPITDCTDQ